MTPQRKAKLSPAEKARQQRETHLEIVDTMERMDKLKLKVILGFVIYWILLVIAIVIAIGHYFIPWIHSF